MKNFELISFATADELASQVAGAWLNEVEKARHSGKPYCVALSGGRITQKFFAAVVQATEEAVANALVANEEMTGRDGHRTPALPRDRVAALFRAAR